MNLSDEAHKTIEALGYADAIELFALAPGQIALGELTRVAVRKFSTLYCDRGLWPHYWREFRTSYESLEADYRRRTSCTDEP